MFSLTTSKKRTTSVLGKETIHLNRSELDKMVASHRNNDAEGNARFRAWYSQWAPENTQVTLDGDLITIKITNENQDYTPEFTDQLFELARKLQDHLPHRKCVIGRTITGTEFRHVAWLDLRPLGDAALYLNNISGNVAMAMKTAKGDITPMWNAFVNTTIADFQ